MADVALSPEAAAPIVFTNSSPLFSQGHLFEEHGRVHFFAANGSRIYEIPRDVANLIYASALAGQNAEHNPEIDSLLARYGLAAPLYIVPDAPEVFPIRSLSLAISETCNLGCTYCYAQGGSFGGPDRQMPEDIAIQSVDRLLRDAHPGERMNLAFLGGEPLVNRPTLVRATEYAAKLARIRGLDLSFSISTNGTLVNKDDGAFFEHYGFSVTVSLDGVEEDHDRLRIFKGGAGSYRRIIERIRPLIAMQHRMQVSARVTVTPRNLSLRRTLDSLIGLGFHSVGFSPMLSSPTRADEMEEHALEVMLQQMIECGLICETSILDGQRYAFSNFLAAMYELHKGTHRPYPCGAGAGYFGVSAEGRLSACHRFVEDEAGNMGDIATGVDQQRQRSWLAARHADHQEPCRTCWARYLCGGGCHHEVIHRGRPACRYIRGWLHFCLESYARLLRLRPDFFYGISHPIPAPEAASRDQTHKPAVVLGSTSALQRGEPDAH